MFSCDLTRDEIPTSGKTKLPDEQIDSVKIVSIKLNVKEYELEANHIDRFYQTKKVFADTVFVKTFNQDGSLKSTLSCLQAEVDEAKNIMIARENVVIKSENGILKTPYLVWNRNNDEIHAKQNVILIRNDNTLNGREMITDINLEKIKILEVSAEGKIEKDEIDW